MHTTVPFLALESALSQARLSPYRTFFKCTRDNEVLAAFQWNQTVASAMWPLVSLVELSLRNRLHGCFSQLYGGSTSNDWYMGHRMPMSASASRKVTDVLAAKDARGQPLCQSVDDVVASVSFGFWIEVLRGIPGNRRWRVTKSVFPGYGPVADKTLWVAPAATWMPLLNRLERHKAFRDRLAHHRPLWRWRYAPNPGAPLAVPTSPGAAMTSLRQEVAHLEKTLSEMDAALLQFWRHSLPHRIFNSLTTTIGLHYSLHRPEEIAQQIQPFRSPGYRVRSQELHFNGPAKLV